MNDDKVKMVIVVRRKFPDGKGGTFGIRFGKGGAQIAHSAEAWLIEKMNRLQAPRLCGSRPAWTPVEQEYLATGTTKIVVRAESEEQLMDIFRQAQEAKLPVHLITDAGRTEFKEPTVTCLAIGPARSSDVDKITGNLPLE